MGIKLSVGGWMRDAKGADGCCPDSCRKLGLNASYDPIALGRVIASMNNQITKKYFF